MTPPRTQSLTALGSYAANPAGTTSIGDGIERAHNDLAGISGYDKKAIIVFTDGEENTPKYLSDISSLINEYVFAVGLGTADELDPAALNTICNGHNGYLLLTDQLDDDDTFKLAKYFLQIQAGINNEQIVVDPSGYVAPGPAIKIPFYLNETDISVDAIMMMPMQGLIDVAIGTPKGDVIKSSNLSSFPTVKKVDGAQVTYYRMTLPVSDGASINAQNGQWNILLKVNQKYYKRYLAELEKSQDQYQQAVAHGVKYTALVHAYSNLRMKCTLSQNSYETGAAMSLRCLITEYGVPLEKDVSVTASLFMPDGTLNSIVLNKVSSGIYDIQLPANYPGIYVFTVQANGFTSRNLSFTREKVLTAAVWKGGDAPAPTSSTDPNQNPFQVTICKFLNCLKRTMDKGAKERLAKNGFDIDALMKCFCHYNSFNKKE